MALTPRSAAVFLIDCNASMNSLHQFGDDREEDGSVKQRSSLDVAKEYVKAKIVQRIIRDLKTIPVAVLAFGFTKTKNIMTTKAKETARENGEAFDRSSDGYQGIYELVPFTFGPDTSTLERVDQLLVAGAGQPGDAHTAMIAGLETLTTQYATRNYQTKELFLFTDGESPIDWEDWQGTKQGLEENGLSLKVIGVNFDDETTGYAEENKSEIKRENESMYHKLIHKLNKRLEDTDSSDSSMVVNATRALTAISTPSVKVVNSRADTMALRLGNPEMNPDRSLTMWINVTKAVVSAPVPSMKKMSLAGFDRAQHSEEASQSTFASKPSLAGKKRGFDKINDVEDVEDDDDDEEGNGEELNKVLSKKEAAKLFNEKQQSSLFPASLTTMGKIGANFEKTLRSAGLQESDHPDADLASHDVITQKRYFYRPPPDPKKAPTEIKVKKKTILGGESDEEQEGGGEGDDVEADAGRTEVDDHAQLVDAYFYGGEMVLTGDFEEAFGKLSDLKMGMDILHFMKTSDVRYDWRMGDVFHVYASKGQSGSEKLFSALVNGMQERLSCAVVRFVKKGFTSGKTSQHVMPDPQLGILFPASDPEVGSEFCYYIRLPFGEDIRSFEFPSLSNLFNRKGLRIESHPLLPTEEQDAAMDKFVDAMDLTEAAKVDGDGETTPWFDITQSFSPAIHNVQNTLTFRLTNPDGDLPPVPRILTQYMDPPRNLVESAEEAKAAAVKAFKISAVPPKPKKITKANENYVQPEDDHAKGDIAALFGSNKVPIDHSKAPRVSQVVVKATGLEIQDSSQSQNTQPQNLAPIVDEDEEMGEEPDTEDEDEDEDTSFANTTAATSVSGSGGESISQLVDNACHLVETSFSSQNFSKATAELNKARNEAMRRNTPSSYNSSLRSFANRLSTHKHRDYLSYLASEELGLLVGGGTTEDDAEAFLEALT
ncbi:hypothetical protein JCM5353_002754 [Sporobolomyces roseus]